MSLNLMNFNEYDEDTVKHLREVQLMILKDFIEICKKNNIEYYAYAGTALGAVRHNGFIPWDDDIDVIMFRNEYDKFVKVFKQVNSKKYSLLTIDDTEDYFYFLSKLSLNNTEFKSSWARKTNFKLGIHIDIFILNHVPDNKIKRWIYFKKRTMYANLLAVFVTDLNKNYTNKKIEIISKVGIKFLNLFKITPQKAKKWYKNFVDKNNDKYDKYVFENWAGSYEEAFEKSVFKPPVSVQFEDIKINLPNDYDTYLKIMYGEYMKLPPEEDRTVHPHDYIDFGKY